jgi:hypothetical protein
MTEPRRSFLPGDGGRTIPQSAIKINNPTIVATQPPRDWVIRSIPRTRTVHNNSVNRPHFGQPGRHPAKTREKSRGRYKLIKPANWLGWMASPSKTGILKSCAGFKDTRIGILTISSRATIPMTLKPAATSNITIVAIMTNRRVVMTIAIYRQTASPRISPVALGSVSSGSAVTRIPIDNARPQSSRARLKGVDGRFGCRGSVTRGRSQIRARRTRTIRVMGRYACGKRRKGTAMHRTIPSGNINRYWLPDRLLAVRCSAGVVNTFFPALVNQIRAINRHPCRGRQPRAF